MKNISKTTKTILFASLIAALILPFSVMEFAEAAISTEEPIRDVNKIKIATNELIDRRAQLPPGEDKTQINYQISALKTAQKLATAIDRGMESGPYGQKHIDKLLEIVRDSGHIVESSISSELPSQALELNMINSRTDSFDVEQLNTSCNQDVLAGTTGNLIQYGNYSMWKFNTYYPPTINEPYTIDCKQEHTWTELNIVKLTGSSISACSEIFLMNDYSETVSCEGIGLDDETLSVNVIIVTSNAYYYDFNIGTFDYVPFTKATGYTFIIY